MDVSLILLTYNRPQLLKRSLLSLVRQDWPKEKFEIIIVDDGSIDTATDIIKNFLIKYPDIRFFYQSHRGVSSARNLGVENARGDFLAFIADDYYLPNDYLPRALGFFKQYPEARALTFNILTCGSSVFNPIQQLYLQLTLWQVIKEDFKNNGGIARSYNLPASRAAVFRKEIFSEIGLFDEDLIGGEDSDLTIRLAKKGIPVYFISNYYITHWEERNLFLLLRKYWQHGCSYVYLLRKWTPESELLNFPVLGVLRLCFKKYSQFLFLSRKIGRLKDYILFSPFILTILITRYLSIYFEAKK